MSRLSIALARRPKWVRYVAAVAAAALAAGCVFGAMKAIVFVRFLRHIKVAAAAEPAAVAAWRAEFGDPQELLASVPKQTDDDATAFALSQDAHELGIEMARPAPNPDGSRRDAVQTENAELFDALRDYESSEVRKVGGPIALQPRNVLAFLEVHRSTVDRMVELLAESEPPHWKMNEMLGPESSVPNLSGLVRVHRILAAEALTKAQGGDDAGVDKAMRASWHLNASLRDRPQLISQLVAIAIARMQAGLARRLLRLPAEEWKTRFQEHDYRASLLWALTVEAAGLIRALPSDPSTFSRASQADFMNMERHFLIACRDSPVSAASDAVYRAANVEPDPLSAGEILGSIAIPNLANSWSRANRLAVDLELTTKILEARAQRTRLGHWPEEIPGVEKSRLSGAHWMYSVSDSGRMSITCSVKPGWRDQQGLVLPLEFWEE